MSESRVPDFRQYLEEWSQDLELVGQNRVLTESEFIRFARDRGVAVSGLITGDPGDLHDRGCLTGDGTDPSGRPLFHPFRIYPLYKTLEACKVNIAASASLRRETVFGLVERVLAYLPSVDEIRGAAQEANRVVDLAILLEPLYWPQITGRLRLGLGESNLETLRDLYRNKALHLVRGLNPTAWRETHESLRKDAAWMDANCELYLLLRLATWTQREWLTGPIAGALWIRHIAEVIRRAFEEVYSERWPEEDTAFRGWHPGGRKRMFGSERPLDDETQSRPYLALRYGLFTGSALRWYVEGETEFFATSEVLPEPSRFGVELVNLRGRFRELGDWLAEDKAFRRFSMISFDRDVKANEKAIRAQIDQQNVVGIIAAHNPDFEFANFSIQELAEVAARIDERNDFAGNPVRHADWTGIRSGRAFEARYKKVSARQGRELKGEEWGRALASYASEHPCRSDTGSERPFWLEIRAALQGRSSDYDHQKERFEFNRETFEQFDRRATDAKAVTG